MIFHFPEKHQLKQKAKSENAMQLVHIFENLKAEQIKRQNEYFYHIIIHIHFHTWMY